MLALMRDEGLSVSKPISFQEYLRQHNLGNHDTAASISVDSLARLDPLLRNNGVFIFRLGQARESRGTAFSCVNYGSEMLLPILIDSQVFDCAKIDGFFPKVPYSSIQPFFLIPNLTETSTVNLGLATGLIPFALGINESISIPATGQGVYSFSFLPNGKQSKLLEHNNGQVEIDSVFTARRDGQDCLFVVEAKCSTKFDSLAKHKLAYPYFSIKPKVPEYLTVVLIYCRVIKKVDSLVYYIAECSIDRNDVNSIHAEKVHAYELSKGVGF